MTESNAELMRKGLEGISTDGWEAMLPLAHEDFEMTTPPGLATEPDTYRGEEGIRRYWESFYEVMDDIIIEPKEFHEVEDWVVVPFTLRATGKSTGIETELVAVMAWQWRDGKAVRALVFPELEEALATVPLRD